MIMFISKVDGFSLRVVRKLISKHESFKIIVSRVTSCPISHAIRFFNFNRSFAMSVLLHAYNIIIFFE